MAIAWDRIDPLKVAQLLHCRPELESQLKACRPDLGQETDYRLYCPCYSGGRCDHDGHMCLKDRGDVCSFWDNEQDEIRARKGE